MKKYLTAILLFLFVSTAVAASSPVSTLDSVANQIISSLRQNKANLKRNPTLTHRIVYRYLIPHVDVSGMSRSVLGRNAWKKATKTQRARFTKVFTQLVVRTYSGALADYTNERIKFFPLRSGYAGKKRVKVSSAIVRTRGPNIRIDYRVILLKGSWKIYDMSIEGVSLLRSFRSQFKQVLSGSNLDGLIKKLQRRNRGRS